MGREMLSKKDQSIKAAFESIGGGKDSKVDLQELTKVISSQVGAGHEEEIREIFEMIDDNRDGTITLAEFQTHVMDDKYKHLTSKAAADAVLLAQLKEMLKLNDNRSAFKEAFNTF